MAKQTENVKKEKKSVEKPPLVPEKYQDIVYIGGIFLIVFIFFGSAIFKGGFNVSDNIAHHSFKNFLEQADEKGEFPLWIPHIFGGMPSYASLLITGNRSWDYTYKVIFGTTQAVGEIFGSDVARMAFYYFLYGLGLYLLMRFKRHDRFTAFFVAIGAIFSTYVITWVMIGHNTKPVVFAMFPFIFLFMERLKNKVTILDTVLLVLAIHVMFEAGHLQMIFYGAMAFGLAIIVDIIIRLVNKGNALIPIRTGILLIFAAGLAFLMSSDRYLSSMEYQKYSTRGAASIEELEEQAIAESKSEAAKAKEHEKIDKANYEYCTMWSYAPKEVLTFFNPSYFGFGIIKYNHPNAGPKDKAMLIPTYWGQKNSEDSPPYMGIGILGLGILGLILFRRDPFVISLGVIAIFSLFLSFGKNLSFLYDIFYYNIPLFNKFRAPSMSLALMHFAMPILAGYGLTGIIQWGKKATEKEMKAVKIGLYTALGFLGLGIIFSVVFKSSYMSAVNSNQSIAYYSQQLKDLPDIIWSNMTTDWYVVGVIGVLFALFIMMFVKKKITSPVFFAGLIILLVVDLWRVDYRRMDISDKNIDNDVFAKHEKLYKGLQKEAQSSIFRVADMRPEARENINAYFGIESLNGYHSAKLRIYQDLLDVANLKEARGSTSILYNQYLWELLNVKYIIQGGQIMRNHAMERAFFVNRAEVKEPMDILNTMREWGEMYRKKPGQTPANDLVFVEKELPVKIDPPDETAYAKVLEHENHYVKIEANASGNNLLFLGDVYYPAGWTAYIDGKETETFKTQYAFRSVIVTKGKHDVEFKFRSEIFETGKTLSMLTNILILIAGAFGLFLVWKKKK